MLPAGPEQQERQEEDTVIDVSKMWHDNVAADPVLGNGTGPRPSFTPREDIMTEQPQQSPSLVRSALGTIHRDMHMIGGAIDHAWPFIKLLATNQKLDAMVETWLEAENMGVAAEAFEAATDSLRGAVARKKAQNAADAANGSGGVQALPSGPYPAQEAAGQTTEAMQLGPDGLPQ